MLSLSTSGSSSRRKSDGGVLFGPPQVSKAGSLFLGRSPSTWKKNGGGKSVAPGLLMDFRCIKHSPRVAIRKIKDTSEMHEFESAQWRNAFEKMGKLQKLGLKPPSPFTVLNKAPYHCPSLGRTFNVDYGPLSQVEGASVKGNVVPKKEVWQGMCQSINATQLPTMTECAKPDSISTRLLNFARREVFYYLPKSTVIVKWDPALHSNRQKICEWVLNTFGLYQFTLAFDTNASLVAFDTLQQAHYAVNFKLSPKARINITWYDPKLNNYANFMEIKNYTMDTDITWQKLGLPKMKSYERLKRNSRAPLKSFEMT